MLILAHRKELLAQCGRKLHDNGVDFAYVRPKFTPDYNKAVQVGTIQTVVGRMDKMRYWNAGTADWELWVPDLIVIDEAHRSLAPTYRRILERYHEALLLGVTATPVRGDKQPLRLLYQTMVQGPSYRTLIDRGFLKRPRTFGPKVVIDLSGVAVTASGEYNLDQLAEAVDRTEVTGDAVESYIKICPGVPAVAFCVSIKHSLRVADDFRRAGYTFRHIDGAMNDKERDAIIAELVAGDIHGITSVDLVTEGFDAPILQCGILLRPTRNKGLYYQMVGRILRPYLGQECAFLLDHSDLRKRHGPVDQELKWSIDGDVPDESGRGNSSGRPPASKQCPDCMLVHEPLPECPECGYRYGREVEVVPGELVESLSPALSKGDGAEGDAVLEQLREIGRRKGYADSWAVNVWAEMGNR